MLGDAMPRTLLLIAAPLMLAACGMSPEEREAYLEHGVTVRAAHLTARGDSSVLPWVQAEARGGVELVSFRIRLYDDRDGDGEPDEVEYTGIARVRDASGGGSDTLLKISTFTFKNDLKRPLLLCEVDTDEGLHTQILVLD